MKTIEKEKLAIIKWVTGLTDEATLEKLHLLREAPYQNDWWSQVSDAEKLAIDKGQADLKAGRVQSHTIVSGRYEKWI